jgi:signal transduction histidine kinase
MVVPEEPGFIEAWVSPVRESLMVTIFVAAIAALALRMRGATQPQRRTLAPVLIAAVIQLLLLVVFVVARRRDPGAPALDVLGWLAGLCVPLVALAFLVGLVRWRLYVARALERLTVATRRRMSPDELRASVASAVADASLELTFMSDRGWIDPAGEPVGRPVAGAGQRVTELRNDEGLVGALVHDEALADDLEFVDAVAACTLAAIEHQRMEQTLTGDRGFAERRARLLAEVDDERRRLERDLHDGTQQRLVALAIKLELAREELAGSDNAGSTALEGLGAEVEEIIDEIRSLARGVYPSLLADRGLVPALEAAAVRSPVHVDVRARDIDRYDGAIEAAVYFTCLEALQNVVKHARDATGVCVTLRANGRLSFEIRDDGDGFAAPRARVGSGLTSMRERIAGVGGTLAVVTAPGHGTRVIGSLPLDRSAH